MGWLRDEFNFEARNARSLRRLEEANAKAEQRKLGIKPSKLPKVKPHSVQINPVLNQPPKQQVSAPAPSRNTPITAAPVATPISNTDAQKLVNPNVNSTEVFTQVKQYLVDRGFGPNVYFKGDLCLSQGESGQTL